MKLRTLCFFHVGLALRTAFRGTFIPPCSCNCCSNQLADCPDSRLCTPGDDIKCMVENQAKAPKCNTWLDKNFMPFDCEVTAVWQRHRKPGVNPKTMGHNAFCEEFCHGETQNSGALCVENRVPTIPPVTCCPCSNNGTEPISPKMSIVSPKSFLGMRKDCSPQCCSS